MINLMQGDCLERMKEIPDGSVDMVLTDPPYGTTACAWDSVIPFDLMWSQLKRVIKPNGAIVLFGDEPFSSDLRLSAREWYKYDWVWLKTKAIGHTNAKNKPMKRHELISVFSEGTTANRSPRKMPYYPQGLTPFGKEVGGVRRGPAVGANGGHGWERPSHKEKYIQEFTNYPVQSLEFASEGATVHPTQKPVALMEYLIKTYANPGETVLDFTMGSGTTGVACMNTGREFIGIELDPDYFKIAEDRIFEALLK